MTGGRAYLYDPSGRHTAALNGEPRDWRPALDHRPRARRRRGAHGRARRAAPGPPRRRVGAAARLLDAGDIGDVFWVVEPVVAATVVARRSRPPCRSRSPSAGAPPTAGRRRLVSAADRGERPFRLGEVEPVVAGGEAADQVVALRATLAVDTDPLPVGRRRPAPQAAGSPSAAPRTAR